MKILLIANPTAGGDALTKIRRAQAAFERRGCTVELVLTSARGDAERAAAIAKTQGYDRIVAAGGDGTLNEAINGLAPATLPLAFIPLGTVNVLALELGIPFNLDAACAVALDGQPQPVSIGRAGERKFLLMAGIGFDADVVRRVNSRLKRRIGRFAYVVAAVAALVRWRAPQLRVTLADGTRESACNVIVGNGRLYGGRFSLTPGARLHEQEFEVLLLRRPGRLALLRVALCAALNRPIRPTDGRLLRTAQLTIDGQAPVQVDGDDLGDLPLDFEILPDAIVLVIPAQRAG